ncbi:hypothetical protein [Deinococcus sp.]|uniref:hypothetical protein n=1 Tax=Deinococcus sp. TaxID=47478 RepID=UPI003C7EBA6C
MSAWAATAYVSGALPLPDTGTAAAWHALGVLSAMCTGPGFEEGHPEDLIHAVLSSLEGVPRLQN